MRYFKQLHPPAFWRFDDQGNGSLSANGQDNWTGSVCIATDVERDANVIETDEHWEPLSQTRHFRSCTDTVFLRLNPNRSVEKWLKEAWVETIVLDADHIQKMLDKGILIETDSTGGLLTKAPSPDAINYPGGVPRQIQVLRAQKAIKEEARSQDDPDKATLTRERDAAIAEIGTLGRQLGGSQATVAAMAAALRKFVLAKELWLPDSILPDHEGELVALTGLLTEAEVALAPDAGKGWMSPEEAAELHMQRTSFISWMAWLIGGWNASPPNWGRLSGYVTDINDDEEVARYLVKSHEHSATQRLREETTKLKAEIYEARAESAALREVIEAIDWIAGSMGDERTLRSSLDSIRHRIADFKSRTAPAQTGRVEAPKAAYESESAKEHFPHEWRVAIYAFDHGGAIEAATNLIQAWEKGHEPMGSGNYRAPELGRLHNMDCKKVRGENLTTGRAGRVLDLERQPGIPLEQWENQDAAERERKRRSGQGDGGEK